MVIQKGWHVPQKADTHPQLTIRFYISIETASTDTEIFFFDLAWSSVTESFVKPLVVIIPFDIFKESQTNLLNVVKNTVAVQGSVNKSL